MARQLRSMFLWTADGPPTARPPWERPLRYSGMSPTGQRLVHTDPPCIDCGQPSGEIRLVQAQGFNRRDCEAIDRAEDTGLCASCRNDRQLRAIERTIASL